MPCLRHYLSDQGCREQVSITALLTQLANKIYKNCPFEHDDDLTPTELQDLKEMAAAMPCDYVNTSRFYI
jgi:hypothetical protein